MDDEALDGWLRRAATERPRVRVGADFQAQVWRRVGQRMVIRERRRRILLGLVIFVVGLGSGMGATWSLPDSDATAYNLADGSELSPAALLRVAP